MSADQTAQLIYLGALAAAIAGALLLRSRGSMGPMLQNAVVWGLIFVGVIVGYGLWEDLRGTVQPSQSVLSDTGQIVLPRSPDGHYYVTLDINDAPVDFVVDTGASDMVLTQLDAVRIGYSLDELTFFGRASTANGEVRTAPVVLDKVSLGPFTDTRVRASVNGGEMAQSLLGMTYLQRFDKIEISDGQLIFSR